MTHIATLTMNPTIDVSFEVDRLIHTQKMRGRSERHDPGGGGINVARVFVRLGGNARCIYLAGGATGTALDGLIDLHQLVRTRISIEGETRVSTSVCEASTGRQYRFVTDGPVVRAAEWQRCLDAVAEIDCDYFVASGSLPRGVPDDFFAMVATTATRRGARFVLDSSGAGLAKGLAGGGVYLVKPSVEELSQFTGKVLDSRESLQAAARHIVDLGQAEHVAVTMGSEGALLVSARGSEYLPAIPVRTASSVGAGDSFLAAMVHALASGRPIDAGFRRGIAAGAAATLRPGTDLARADDVERLYEEMLAR